MFVEIGSGRWLQPLVAQVLTRHCRVARSPPARCRNRHDAREPDAPHDHADPSGGCFGMTRSSQEKRPLPASGRFTCGSPTRSLSSRQRYENVGSPRFRMSDVGTRQQRPDGALPTGGGRRGWHSSRFNRAGVTSRGLGSVCGVAATSQEFGRDEHPFLQVGQ